MQEFDATGDLSAEIEDPVRREFPLVVVNLTVQTSMAQLSDDGNSGLHDDPQETNHMRMSVSHAKGLQQPNLILELSLLMAEMRVDEFLDGYPCS